MSMSYFSWVHVCRIAEKLLFSQSWMSHKSRPPVETVSAAEILAAAEAIDERQVLKSAFSALLRTWLRRRFALDSHDLFISLSTNRNSVDKSICANASDICYKYETPIIDEVFSILGSANLPDPGIRAASQQAVALQLMLICGKISIDMLQQEARPVERLLG